MNWHNHQKIIDLIKNSKSNAKKILLSILENICNINSLRIKFENLAISTKKRDIEKRFYQPDSKLAKYIQAQKEKDNLERKAVTEKIEDIYHESNVINDKCLNTLQKIDTLDSNCKKIVICSKKTVEISDDCEQSIEKELFPRIVYICNYNEKIISTQNQIEKDLEAFKKSIIESP